MNIKNKTTSIDNNGVIHVYELDAKDADIIEEHIKKLAKKNWKIFPAQLLIGIYAIQHGTF